MYQNVSADVGSTAGENTWQQGIESDDLLIDSGLRGCVLTEK